MERLVRFGISLDEKLLEKFDAHIDKQGYTNRSEAIRDLIREDLVKREWQEGVQIAGAVTLIYDHHRRELLNTLTDIQHDFQEIIISTQHVHLDHHNCLEIIAVRGPAPKVVRLANLLKVVKGVKHCTLGMSTTGQGLT